MPTVPVLSDEDIYGPSSVGDAPEQAAPMQVSQSPQPAQAEMPAAPAGGLLTDADVFGTGELKVRVRESARAAAGKTPDQVLGAEALADRYGVPPAVAGRNMDDLKRRAEVDDMAALVDTNPRLAEWFADDPDAVAVARDDVGPLSQLETMLAFSNPFTAGVAIADQVTGAGLARPAVDVLGSLTQGIGQPLGTAVSGAGALLDVGARQIDRNVRGLFGDDIADLFWFDGPRYANPANILNDLGEGVESITNAGAPPEERQGLVTDVISGLGQVGTYAAVTTLTGGAGGILMGAGQGADIQADRARDAGTYGTGSSDIATVGGAAITSVTERLGLKWLFRQLPKSVQAGMQKRVADILLAGAGEAAQEITEGVAQDAVTKALVDSEYEMFRGLDREALAAGGVGIIVRSMLHVGRGRMDSEQAKNERGEIAEVGRLVDSMGLAAKDPGRLKAALARLKTAGWNDIYVPVTEWQTLFQSAAESDAARLAAGVTDSDYTAALLSGGKLRVPTEGFYTGLTPEQRKPLYEHARRSAEGMTPAEADGYDPDAAMAEFMEQIGAEGRPAGDQSNQVYDEFRLQLERAGASPDVASAQAEQLAAFVRTQSARSGVRIDAGRLAVVAQMDPRLQAVLRGPRAEPALDALIAGARSGRVFNEREVQGMRLVSLLVKMGGINPEAAGAGDLKAMDAQKLRPGLLSLAGMTLDDALQAARDEGYITTPLSNEGEVYDGDAPDISSLLEMISGDLSGMDPVYAPESLNMDRAAFNEGVAALQEELQAKGISTEMLAEMSDAQVREALGFGPSVGEVDAEGQVLDQTAYHGTPHNVDRFSLQKIGTGEGAQAFGWGLYFAGKQAVAEHYRKALTDATAPVASMTVRGQAVDPDSPEGHGARLIAHNGKAEMKRLAKAMLDDAKAGDPYTVETASKQGLDAVEYYERVAAAINSLSTRDVKIERGRVYKVEIPDDADLLDNEGKIANQNAKVQEVARAFLRAEGYLREGENGPRQLASSFREAAMALGGMARGADGVTLYEMLSKKLGSEQAASQYLNEHGIPGLKYKAGQIAGVKNAGTNYVIWDEAAIGEPVSLYQSAAPAAIDLTPSTRTRRITAGPSSLTYSVQDGVAKIVLVRTPRESRGQGGARQVMREFLAATDAAGLPVTLTVAEQDSTTDAGRLASFYESLGFVRGEGDSMSREAVAPGSSASNPLPSDMQDTAPVGAWVESGSPDLRGRPVLQVREISVGEIRAPEIGDDGQVSPDKRADVPGYVARLQAGEQAPNLYAVEQEDGGVRLVDGHRRLAAAREAGRPTVRVLVSPLVDLPGEGKVTLTAEVAARQTAAPAVDQTQTPEFKAWFGDSKVVDADGKPLVVYHGTSSDFTAFANRYAGRTWEMFSDSSEYSNRFASSRGGRLMPVYLSIKNPLDMRQLPAIRGDVRNKLIRLLEGAGVKFDDNFKMKDLPYERDLFQIVNMAGHKSGFADAVMAAGYDGIIMPDNHDGDFMDDGGIIATTYIALSPTQIKSATGNRGTFDQNDPSILNQSDDYRGQHMAPTASSGAPGHDITGGGNYYPDDVYGPNGARYYGTGNDAIDAEAFAIARGMKGKPNATVTIYRAVPKIKGKAELLADVLARMKQIMARGGAQPGEYDRLANERDRLTALPDEAPAEKLTINPGDWVGITRAYAKDHGESVHGKGGYTIISKKVKASQIFTNGDSIQEWGYDDGTVLDQQGGANPRGSITISPSRYPGGVRTFVIKLGEKRDFSTFLHESAHFYLEILREIDAELRAADPAGLTPDQIKVLADHDALLKELGVPSFDAITVKQHEAFAETYEAYLREGKAPSVRLARAFQKFGTWLKMVYRSIRNLPNQQLNDEVRGIFDRMLATDDEIDAARSAQSLGALFATPEAAGMTPDEFAQYQEALRVARDSAVTGEAAEQYRFEVAETRRWRTEEMARIRAEVAVDVDASAGMRAKYLLRAGTLPDGSPLPAGQSPIKLNTTVVTDKYGKEWVKRNLAFMTAGEGVHPDLAAPLLGFKDGEALLAALANTPSRAAAIKAEADSRWRDRHPDPMTDGELSDRVQARVHNDAQAEVMIREIAALNARAGRDPGRPNVLAVMKAAAERITSAQRVGSLNPGQYRTTEAKAGRDALKAAAAGKWDEAVSARRRQLFAGIMYRAALDAKERAEGVRDKMVKLAKKPAQERFARAGWESYLERVNDILHAFDVRRLSEKEMGRRRSMRAWVEAQQEAGDVTAITDDLIARVEAQSVLNWRNATVAELDAAGDALTNIEHLARLKNKLLAGARAAEKEQAVEELLARAADVLPDAVERPVSRADLSLTQRGVRAVEAKRDEVTRPENMIEALDGGESGPWHDFIWSAMESAELKMVALRRDLGAKLKALRTEMPNDVVSLIAEPVTVFGVPTTRASLIGAVLNTGNAGNLQRLRDGGIAFNDRKLRLTEAQVGELRGMLTAAELRYVQGLWTAVNSMWGDIVALQRAMSGLPPEKVEAQAFTVLSADGVRMELEGGYWPLAYDRDRSAVGENQSGEDALRVMMGQGFTKAATPKGYQKARVAEFEAPLQLDFGAVLSRHMDQVMTDIAYRAAVRDVMSLLNDQRVKESILAKLGRPAYDSLRGMVSYSVSGSSRVAGTAASGWQNLADGILSNMTVSALAIRPDIALGNYTSAMVQGLDRTGVRALLRGLWATYTPGRGDMTAEVKRLSPFMAERLDETDFIYQQELARTRRERGIGAAYKRVMMSLHRGADHEVTRALWWGKFHNEIDGGATQAEAVRLADKAIRQTQTAVGRKDLSTFERDPAFRQSRQFMGPMFVIFGRLNAAARGQGTTRTIGPRVATVMLQVFMAPALFALMAGRWPEDGDDDDDEIGVNEWAIWLAANTAMFPLQTLPFLRDVGSGIESALTGNPINPRAAPVSAAGANIIKAGKSIWDNLDEYQETGEMDWYDMTRDLTTMAAPFVAAPASQVRQTTRALEAFRDNPDAGALEMTSMAVYGKMPPTSSE